MTTLTTPSLLTMFKDNSHSAPKITEYLDLGANIDETDEHGYTALMLALCKERLDIALILLDRGANPDTSTHKTETALSIAADKGYLSVVRELIRKKATVDAGGGLVKAATRGNYDIVEALLDAGATIDLKRDDYTALLQAIYQNNDKTAILLIERGADVNIPYGFGATALIRAIEAGYNPALIRALLDHGAELHAKDSSGNTAFDVAIDYGHKDFADMITAEIPRRQKIEDELKEKRIEAAIIKHTVVTAPFTAPKKIKLKIPGGMA